MRQNPNIIGGSFLDRFNSKKDTSLEDQINELKSTNSRLESKIKCYRANCKGDGICDCSICESKFTDPTKISIPQQVQRPQILAQSQNIKPVTPVLAPSKYDISAIPYSNLNPQNIKLESKPKTKPKSSSILSHKNLTELEKSVKEEEKKKLEENKKRLEKDKEAKKLEKNKYGNSKCYVLDFDCVITTSSWFGFIKTYDKWLSDVKAKTEQATIKYLENPAIQNYLKDISTMIFNVSKNDFNEQKIKELTKEINKVRNVEINGRNFEKTGTNLIKEFIMGFENRIMQLKLFLTRLKSKGINLGVLPRSMIFYIKLLLNIVNIPEMLLNINIIKDMQDTEFKHISEFDNLTEERDKFLKQVELSNKCKVNYIHNKYFHLPINPINKESVNYYEIDNLCGLSGRDMNTILEKNNLARIMMVGGDNMNQYFKKYLKYKKKYLLTKYA